MEEPVEKRSDKVTKRNCAEDQITNSSAKRLRCIAQIEATDRNSNAKSRSLTASSDIIITYLLHVYKPTIFLAANFQIYMFVILYE